MSPADAEELRDCLDLLVRQARQRCIDLKDHPDLLCAIDKQTLDRAMKALEKVK